MQFRSEPSVNQARMTVPVNRLEAYLTRRVFETMSNEDLQKSESNRNFVTAKHYDIQSLFKSLDNGGIPIVESPSQVFQVVHLYKLLKEKIICYEMSCYCKECYEYKDVQFNWCSCSMPMVKKIEPFCIRSYL